MEYKTIYDMILANHTDELTNIAKSILSITDKMIEEVSSEHYISDTKETTIRSQIHGAILVTLGIVLADDLNKEQ